MDSLVRVIYTGFYLLVTGDTELHCSSFHSKTVIRMRFKSLVIVVTTKPTHLCILDGHCYHKLKGSIHSIFMEKIT